MGAGEGSSSDKRISPEKKEKAVDKTQLDPEDDNDREEWGNQCEFFLSCLGYAVGFGNVWRFPYLCYKNGGAVFLIPYCIMLLCAGLPLFFMELALGQYVSLGPNILFPKLAPIVSGLGFAMLMISTLVAIYYNMILAWTLFYTFASFTSVLPWSHCDNDFNSIGCMTDYDSSNCTAGYYFYNKTCNDASVLCVEDLEYDPFNSTHCMGENETAITLNKHFPRISPSEDYFKNRMLGVTGRSWEDMGSLRWELVGCLALAWIIVCLCMIKGVKSSGKVVYFTALFPYAVLVILFIRGILLPGSEKGIHFYFTDVKWERLKSVAVWNDAATQIFYSLGSSFGGLITLASYNKFKNNCMRDAIVIAFANCATSVFAGFVIFSILGFMADQLGVEVGDVVTSGSGLAFIAYPAAVTKMPVAPLWALLFFFMLITLGLDSQFTMVETLSTAIFDQWEFLRARKPIVVIGMCFCLFLCGITMCLEGGIFMFELFNGYSAGLSVIILAITEIFAVQYLYGFSKFMDNIRNDMGIHVPAPLYYYWKATWLVVTPISLFVIFAFSLYFWAPVQFGDYVFPTNIQGLGWAICSCSFLLIPIFAVFIIYQNRTNNKEWKELLQHTEDLCPRHERKLRKTQGAATKGAPIGVFRYMNDNEGFQEGEAKVYPRIRDSGSDNDGFQGEGGEAKAYSYGGNNPDNPPPYSNHL